MSGDEEADEVQEGRGFGRGVKKVERLILLFNFWEIFFVCFLHFFPSAF